jgi:hypothetical protein
MTDPSICANLLSLNLEESTMRLFAMTAKQFHRADLAREYLAWVQTALEAPVQSPIEVATKIHLLSKTSSCFPEMSDAVLCEFLNGDSPMAVLLCCCRLLRSFPGASTQAMLQFCGFLPHDPTGTAAKTLRKVLAQRTDLPIIGPLVGPFLVAEIAGQLERGEGGVTQNLTLLSICIRAGADIIDGPLVELITHLLTSSAGFAEELGHLVAEIITIEHPVSLHFVELMLQRLPQIENGFHHFVHPLLAFISHFTPDYLSLQVSPFLLEASLAAFPDPEASLLVSDLISAAIRVDQSVDITKIVELCAVSDQFPNVLQVLGLAEIMASLIISRHIIIGVDHILAVLERGWCVRESDHRLILSALAEASVSYTLQNEEIDDLPIGLADLPDYRIPLGN